MAAVQGLKLYRNPARRGCAKKEQGDQAEGHQVDQQVTRHTMQTFTREPVSANEIGSRAER